MKIPLFCYPCDKITGHLTNSFLEATCRKCGNVRKIPVFRWVLLVIIVIILFTLPILFIWDFLRLLKIL